MHLSAPSLRHSTTAPRLRSTALPRRQECLFAMRTVVAFGGEKRELEKFTKAVAQARSGEDLRNDEDLEVGLMDLNDQMDLKERMDLND